MDKNRHERLIDLQEGEIICDVCKGNFCTQRLHEDMIYRQVCYKCNGAGKVDWVDNVLGKKSQRASLKSDWALSGASIGAAVRENQKIIEKMSKKIAKKIDDELIEYFKGIYGINQNTTSSTKWIY